MALDCTMAEVGGSHNGRRVQLSIDYGTKTLSAAFVVKEAGDHKTLEKARVKPLQLVPRKPEIAQLVAYSDDGEKFYWSNELREALRTKQIGQEHVIRLWKLDLYKDHQGSEIVKRVRTQLGRADKTLKDLLVAHFRAIICSAKESLRRGYVSIDRFQP